MTAYLERIVTPGERRAVTDRLVLRLTTPFLPTRTAASIEENFATLLVDDDDWPKVWAAAVLLMLVRGLPQDDPWRHLRARLSTPDGPMSVRLNSRSEIAAHPEGATHPDGRRFGTLLDAADLLPAVHADPSRDNPLAAFEDNLDPRAAFLLAAVSSSKASPVAAMQHIRRERGVYTRGHQKGLADIIIDSLRWATLRRRAYAASLDEGDRLLVVAHKAAVEIASKTCWLPHAQFISRPAPVTGVTWRDMAEAASRYYDDGNAA
ncbi:hypothetical protein [Nocardioides sp. KR10-350]|uniref:hypothetical protein n=1 Tax=Nocardioides cheoyonin TaxID=3156615 RepID=UPI0032B516DF